MALPSRHLFEPSDDVRHSFGVAADDPIHAKTTVLQCTCGILECWFLLVRITLFDDFVVWSDFEQFHRDWVYDLGPFVFDRQAYERARARRVTRGARAPPSPPVPAAMSNVDALS